MYEKRFMALFTILMMLTGTGLLAQQGSVAEVTIEPDHIIIQPIGEFESYTVRLYGPICRFSNTFDGGKTAVLELFDKKGKPFEDGVWRVEITGAPIWTAEQWETITKARMMGDYKTLAVTLPKRGSLSQTNYFSILEGRTVDPNEVEKSAGEFLAKQGKALRDFVINDDLIVDGSACIGFDCVNGESFGFDTIRLKENNLRIKFDDTSVAASFPRTDWQLTANASANGGAAKFSIDDISGGRTPFTVEANAPSHSLYVDDGGRVGMGTSTPSVEIHTIDGDTPTLRLQQDGSSGFAPQTWDVAGNETNFFIRDVTNGSALPFRIRPGADTNALFIDVDNDIGVGTASPDAPVHIRRTDGTAKFKVEDTGASGTEPMLELNSNTSTIISLINNSTSETWNFLNGSSGFRIDDNGGGAEVDIDNTGDIRFGQNNNDYFNIDRASNGGHVTIQNNLTVNGTFSNPSDVNLKEEFEVVDTSEVLDRLVELPITTWRYKKDRDEARHMGVMSQDFYEAFGLGANDKYMTSIDPDGVAMAAIQGLNRKVEEKDGEKDARITRLEQEKQALEDRVAALEKLVNQLVKDK
ncbi:MAG: tail fiber domain-containing protein [Acidobacteriota bacterium]|nr:tail fiber domain-containing protein [Acidobacteriota bacterium]